MSDRDEASLVEHFQAAASLWERGCRGEALTAAEHKGFHRLARDRFYTFVLSVNHSQAQGDGAKIDSLVRSLVLDLDQSPGLKAEWYVSEWADASFGELVTAGLEALER